MNAPESNSNKFAKAPESNEVMNVPESNSNEVMKASELNDVMNAPESNSNEFTKAPELNKVMNAPEIMDVDFVKTLEDIVYENSVTNVDDIDHNNDESNVNEILLQIPFVAGKPIEEAPVGLDAIQGKGTQLDEKNAAHDEDTLTRLQQYASMEDS
jgi:hypothetical protein